MKNENKDEQKYHWFNLSFMSSSSWKAAYKSAYINIDGISVTKDIIDNTKYKLDLGDDAVLQSASYLGYSTKSDFYGTDEDQV